MRETDDRPLAALLNAYQVDDASPQLVDRIIARAMAERPPVVLIWTVRRAGLYLGLCAALLLAGFWLGQQTGTGHTSTVAPRAGQTSSTSILEQILWGPTNIEEIIL